ncbi:MAG TPA: iron ABC transporter permease [Burkholderiales bacterium]|nr:iron ABC transporter permease [Burkholderiales bacterium]
MSHRTALLVLALAAAAAVLVGLAAGSVPIAPGRILSVLVHPGEGAVADIVWKLRLPRVVAAFSCGALLAYAGVLMQALLRNPLADPYVFGISGGAALGVMAGMLVGAGAAAQTALGLGGAVAVALLVLAMGLRSGDWNPYRLLLTGVVVAAGLNALLSLILVLAPQAAVKGMLYWLMGDLGYAGDAWPALLVAALLVAVAMPLTPAMNVLALGRLKAQSLGIAAGRVGVALFAMAAAAAVTSVLVGGTIGFVGLIVPHLVRLAGIADHRWLLPSSALAGGGLLTLADTVARSALAPLQLPVGVLTALIGVPALLLLLGRKQDHAAR